MRSAIARTVGAPASAGEPSRPQLQDTEDDLDPGRLDDERQQAPGRVGRSARGHGVDRMSRVADLGRDAFGGVGRDPRGPGQLQLWTVGVLQEDDRIGRAGGVDGELEQARKGGIEVRGSRGERGCLGKDRLGVASGFGDVGHERLLGAWDRSAHRTPRRSALRGRSRSAYSAR